MSDTQMNKAPLPPQQDDRSDPLDPLPLNRTTEDPLPFEEILEVNTEKSSSGGAGRVLKNKAGQLTLNTKIIEMAHDKTIEMLKNWSWEDTDR
ncbi:hypothetical protein PTTG_29837 [Puccinia triticina 1-1 BBBD Race 1]|uniref:Uncharacterized protein n=1 Tax=Puccinia triticina (isolate 1-1 / race 1 (BBBD)) TaxID=630390 RepID=A0A180G1I2_PUCT1|nr:hypothetical protein PTTG_29837 [Puccinia triticina 1-1 BBBD Race 1]